MRGSWREVLVGLREIRRSPGLAASVAVTVGIGVGANLAVFALLQDAFLPKTPFADPARLTIVENTGLYYYGGNLPEGLASSKLSGPDFRDVSDQQHTFSAIGGVLDGGIAVMGGLDRSRPVCRIFVTPTLFEVLGAQPVLGRLLGPSDFEPSSAGAALVTDGLWRAYLGSDPNVVGRPVRLDEQPFTVVGVVPASMFGLLQQRRGLFTGAARDRCVVTPIVAGLAGESSRAIAFNQQQRDTGWLQAFGRLRPGVTHEAARRDISAIARHMREAYPDTNSRRDLRLVPLDAWRTADVGRLLLILALAASLAFLVACTNASALIMTQSVRRQGELAVRLALGASASHLLVIVLARSVLWSLPGAVLGIMFGRATLGIVQWGASAGTEPLRDAPFGLTAILAGTAMALLAGLASGAVAAWTVRRRNLTDVLSEAGLTTSAGPRRARVARVLVSIQIGGALALTIAGGVLLRNVHDTVSADRGFEMDRGFIIHVRLPRSRFAGSAEQWTFYQQALSRIRLLPGVASAGLSVTPPLSNAMSTLSGSLAVEGPGGTLAFDRLNGQYVSAGYFDALQPRLIRGRLFSEQDEQGNRPVVIVSEGFCRRYLSNTDALASSLRFGREAFAIIGVVGDIGGHVGREAERVASLKLDATAYFLFRRLRNAPTWSFLVVRASTAPPAVMERAVREVLAVDGAACLDDPRTFNQLFAARIAEQRRVLGLLGSFAAIVLLLTALGLAAALAQFVAAHGRDIAIRRVLGARPTDIVALASKHLLPALAGGLAVGGAGGVALARVLSTQIYGLDPGNPFTIASAFAVLAGLAVMAAVGPVWRACRIHPASTLRTL
jgi:putative ABC transport system permease protein